MLTRMEKYKVAELVAEDIADYIVIDTKSKWYEAIRDDWVAKQWYKKYLSKLLKKELIRCL